MIYYEPAEGQGLESGKPGGKHPTTQRAGQTRTTTMKSNELAANFSASVRSTTAFLKRHGCTPVKGHYGSGYHYHSGFFTSPNGLLWYWMTGDDRIDNTILFRRAKHLKDYTGGTNQWPKDGAEFDGLIEWHDRNEVKPEGGKGGSEETDKAV